MKDSRPAKITTHHARREERSNMEEDKKAILAMLGVIRHRQVMRMIREFIHWMAIHQDDLI